MSKLSSAVVINGQPLAPIEVDGQRVVTLAMIDKVHGRADGTAKRNFSNNRARLVEGEDYRELTADEIRTQSLSHVFPARTPKGIVLMETGYLMLVKSLNDDLAWQVQKALVKSYFVSPQMAGIVDHFAPAARSTLGGIVKRVTHAELHEALPALVEPMIERLLDARMLSDRRKLVEGVSALEIAEMAGYTKGNRPRGLIQLITRRIRRYHEDRGILPHRTPHGSCKVLIYVEAVVRRWLTDGGRIEIEAYVAERAGQGKLRLVSAGAKEAFNGQ